MFLKDQSQGQTTVACKCDRCGKVGPAVQAPAETATVRLEARRGFRISVDGVRVLDVCTDCQPTAPVAPAGAPTPRYTPREWSRFSHVLAEAVAAGEVLS